MPSGCKKCWQEFKGWLKAFTPTETLLTFIEALFLILLIVFIVFLILHFLACGKETRDEPRTKFLVIIPDVLDQSTKRPTCTYTPEGASTKQMNAETEMATENSSPFIVTLENEPNINSQTPTDEGQVNISGNNLTEVTEPYGNDTLGEAADFSDGVLVDDDDEKKMVMALVRVKPSGLTFGCILTVVDDHWTVTAASCIDSIEEVDSVDNFVILDDYGAALKGRSHTISDVRVHPLYEGGNTSYDLALLKTDDKLNRQPVRLPSMLDYHRMTIGQAARILGFGHFRSIDHSSNGQQVHSATVYLLPSKHCQQQQFEERHLVPAEQEARGRCGLASLCLGVLYARGTPCNYCAGAPLLHDRTLLGVMADNGQCGAACEPARYANMAAVADWVAGVVEG